MNELGRWPSATDYIDAVQHPAVVFAHDEMKEARFDLDMYGIPDGCTGSNAVVFRAMLGPKTAALRCFVSRAGLSRERYLALARHLRDHAPGARWMVPATWWDEAVLVKGQQWPVVEMEWVDGRPLDVYVGSLCQSQPAALHVLAERWREMLRELATLKVAHGDLQHGNVLVDQSTAAMRLVDLDSAWVPGMDGLTPPAESGHQAFRHPNRPESKQWGPYTDTFAGLVVMVSLVALAHRPGLWGEYNNGDNLVFTADDFVAVDASPLWSDLGEIDDPDFANLLLCLKQCCDPVWQPSCTLEHLMAGVAQARPHRPVPSMPPPPAPPVATDAEPLLRDGIDWEVNVGDSPQVVTQVAAQPTQPAPVAGVASDVDTARSSSLPAPVGPPASTTVLPPPPAVQAPMMNSPVGINVLTPEPQGQDNASNPFQRPPMARGNDASRKSSAPRSMAIRYMGWAVFSTFLLLGLPALMMAKRAQAADHAGDTTRAIQLSHRSKRWSVTSVAVVVLIVLIASSS